MKIKRSCCKTFSLHSVRIGHGDNMELLAALYETNDGEIIRSLVHSICFTSTVIGASGMYIISSIMRHYKHLNAVIFEECGLGEESVQILWDNIKDSNTSIGRFDFSEDNLNEAGNGLIWQIVQHCEVHEFTFGKDTYSKLEAKKSKISKMLKDIKLPKLKVLKLCLFEFTGESLSIIASYLPDGVRLTLQNCHFNESGLQEFKFAMGAKKLQELNISSKSYLPSSEFCLLWEIAQQCEVSKFIIDENDGIDEKLKQLPLKLEEVKNRDITLPKLKHLYISERILPGESLAIIATSISEDASLVLSSCEFDESALWEFKLAVGSKKLRELKVFGNTYMNSATCHLLWQIAQQCEVSEFIINGENSPAYGLPELELEEVEDIKLPKLKVLDLSNMILTGESLAVIATSIPEDVKLILQNCELDESALQEFSLAVGSKKLRELDVSGNMYLGSAVWDSAVCRLLWQIAQQCEVSAFIIKAEEDRDIERENILLALEEVNDIRLPKLKRLDLSNRILTGESLAIIATSIPEDVKLILQDCDLNESALREFKLAMGSKKIKELDISSNKNISEDAFAEVGEIVKQCNVDNVVLQYCSLTSASIEVFASRAKGAKVKVFDVGHNRLSSESLAIIASFIPEGVHLIFEECDLNESAFREFKLAVGTKKITKLDISSDSTISHGGFARLGEIVKECEVDNVVMEHCELTVDRVKEFAFHANGAKIKELNIHWNEMSDDGFAEIAKLVKQCHVDVLVMSRCGLTGVEMEKFAYHAKGAKLSSMDLRKNYLLDPTSTAASIRKYIEAQTIIFGDEHSSVEV